MGDVGERDGVDEGELKDALEFLSELLCLPEPGRDVRSQALCAEVEDRPEPLSLDNREKAVDSVLGPLFITELQF